MRYDWDTIGWGLAPHVKACVNLFNELSHLPGATPSVQTSLNDHLGRFRIWAGNIGAFQENPLPSSLDYRLREAPKVAEQIRDLLDDLCETLRDLRPILCGNQSNRAGELSHVKSKYIVSCHEGSDTASISSDQSEPVSELEELLKSCGDTITTLFKISVLIRSATSRDRCAKAATAQGEPFEPHFDVDHVGHKYPRIRRSEWLEKRLGKAITQRRQYLRYCRDHRERTGAEKRFTEADNHTPRDNRMTTHDRKDSSTRAGKSPTQSMGPSTLAITTASTLNVAALEVLDEGSDEAQSQISYATSMGEDNSGDYLRVPPIPEDANSGLLFECPYCWTVQTIKSRRAWKRHVFQDLRP